MSNLPPVSLLILTYQQERYVEAAVKSALAQDYGNLQIVVSDDCSSDQTLAVARRAAALHAGPHRVIVTQTKVNRGTVSHLCETRKHLTGHLVLLAAGDDISLPHRVSTTVAHWRKHAWDASFGWYHLIDEHERIVRRNYRFDDREVPIRTYFRADPPTSIHGASSCYTQEALALLETEVEGVLFEDSYLTFLLGLRGGKIIEIEEPLVLYRQHDASITNFAQAAGDAASIAKQELRGAKAARSVAIMLDAFERAAERMPYGKVDLERIRADRDFFEVRATWSELSILARLSALKRHGVPAQRRWMAPRLFGPTGLALAKRMRRVAAN